MDTIKCPMCKYDLSGKIRVHTCLTCWAYEQTTIKQNIHKIFIAQIDTIDKIMERLKKERDKQRELLQLMQDIQNDAEAIAELYESYLGKAFES